MKKNLKSDLCSYSCMCRLAGDHNERPTHFLMIELMAYSKRYLFFFGFIDETIVIKLHIWLIQAVVMIMFGNRKCVSNKRV